nr:ribosomal protein L5 [Polyopes affinis]
MQPARLKLYYNYLGNFDFVDKELQTSHLPVTALKPDILNVKFSSNHHSNKNTIIKSLFSEVFGNQRFAIKKTKNAFLKNFFFVLTLRKENLLLFLDNGLNTTFLHEYKSLNNAKLDNKVHFYFNNELTNHFILTSIKLEFFIQYPGSVVLSNQNHPNNWFFIPNL